MPKVQWLDIPQTSSRLIVAVPPGDAGGADIHFPDLQTSLNLLSRSCTKLRLSGRFALQAARNPRAEVRLSFEKCEDAERFAHLVGLAAPLVKTSEFTLDERVLVALEEFAGPPVSKSQRARDPGDLQGPPVSWASRPFRRGSFSPNRRFRKEDLP